MLNYVFCCAVFNFGQGCTSFGIFGLDKHLTIILSKEDVTDGSGVKGGGGSTMMSKNVIERWERKRREMMCAL